MTSDVPATSQAPLMPAGRRTPGGQRGSHANILAHRRWLLSLLFAALLGALVPSSAAAQGCTYTASTTSVTFGHLEGGTRVEVSYPAACSPATPTSEPWIFTTVSDNRTPTSAPMSIYVAENVTGVGRTGTIRMNGQPLVSITQGTEPCVTGFTPATVRSNAAGEVRTATLHTSAADCQWSLMGFPVWVGWPSPLSGRGSATLSFPFTPNLYGAARTFDLSYSGRTIRLEQDGASCVFSIAPTDRTVGPNGGTFSVAVSGVGSACDYTAIISPGLTAIAGAAGVAPATLILSVGPNTTPNGRSFFVLVQNALLTVTQDASPIVTDPADLTFAYYAPAGATPHTTRPERVRITNLTTPIAGWTASATVPWVTLSPASGSAPGSFAIAVDAAAAALMPDGFSHGIVEIRSADAPDSPHFISVGLHVLRTIGSRPRGVFETPRLNGAVASGAIPVTGWATDDIGISRITISRAAVAREAAGEVYVGDAVRVLDARPDVATGTPEGRRAGWGYMLLSNVLPNGGNGTFTLFADVTDIEGQTTRLGPRLVAIDNANAVEPFGTIDEPTQGATVSGTIVNRGWVLTPAGKMIPVDGSTIKVYIDGVLVSAVDRYNQPRPDVQAFFSGRANSPGPGAQLTIDTTRLADGVHTIAWGAIDDAGVPAGIGSRYFTVSNGAASQVLAAADASRPARALGRLPALSTDVWARIGMDDTGWAFSAARDATGARVVRARQGQRLELFLDPMLQGGCGAGYEGYSLMGEIAGPLLVGASLDREHGIFRWQPTAQFRGAYPFLFVHRSCGGTERVLRVIVILESGS